MADCAIEVWSSVVKCVAYWESLSRPRRPQIKSHEQLVECYSNPLVPAKMHFFWFVAGIFEPYLTRFQTDAPMVPFMFDELSAIFKKLVGLIFKKDAIDNAQSIASMLNEKCSNLVWLTLEQERKLFLPLHRLPLKKRDCFNTNANKLSSKSSLSWWKDVHLNSAL